jgi:hypothetical protein
LSATGGGIRPVQAGAEAAVAAVAVAVVEEEEEAEAMARAARAGRLAQRARGAGEDRISAAA